MDHLSKHDLTARYHIIQRSKSKSIIFFKPSVVNSYEVSANRKQNLCFPLVYALYSDFESFSANGFIKKLSEANRGSKKSRFLIQDTAFCYQFMRSVQRWLSA